MQKDRATEIRNSSEPASTKDLVCSSSVVFPTNQELVRQWSSPGHSCKGLVHCEPSQRFTTHGFGFSVKQAPWDREPNGRSTCHLYGLSWRAHNPYLSWSKPRTYLAGSAIDFDHLGTHMSATSCYMTHVTLCCCHVLDSYASMCPFFF